MAPDRPHCLQLEENELPEPAMNGSPWQYWFDYDRAFDHPVTRGAVIAIAAVLMVSAVVAWLLFRLHRINRALHQEIMLRWLSWIWLTLLMLGPILLGPAFVMAAVAVLSLLCYREFARATDLRPEHAIHAVVVLGILAGTFAALDYYPRLFFASAALTVGLITIVTIPQDRPQGYLRRVALGALGFLLFGYSLGYIGCIANDPNYRPILILILLGVELNDVFAFCVGKSIGGPKLLPNTSPGKTVAGSAGALVLTTALVAGLGHLVFEGTAVDRIGYLILLGAGVSVLGQLGDLLLSSVKRDVGIKDTGTVIPGHGGLLDRFDSLVLVPPAVYHFLSLIQGPLGSGQLERIITG
jgi:phosphatidate cytidylyltransferase